MILLLARLAQIVLSVASIKLSSHLLAPEQMGRFALANSIFALFSFMFLNPVGMFMNRRLYSWWRDGQWLGYQLWFGLYVLAVAVFAGLSFVVAAPIYRGLQMDLHWMLLLISGSIIVTIANQVLISSFNLLGFAKPFAVLTVLTPLLGLGLAWMLCDLFQPRTEYWLSGLLIGQAATVTAALFIYRQKWHARVGPTQMVRLSPDLLRRLLVYAWPISVAVVLGWSQNQGYRLVIENQIGLRELGIFVAAYGIALGIMSAVESLLASLLQPRFYQRLNAPGASSSTAAWNEYAATALPILVLTATTLAAAAPEAVRVFLAPAYWHTVEYVRWAAAIELTRTAANVYGLAMHAEMNTRRLILPSLLGAVLSVGFLTVASRLWGLAGVGPALALAGLLYLVSYHLAARELSGVSVPVRRVTLSLAGGLLTLGVVSAVRLLDVPSTTYTAAALRSAPAALVYVLFAAVLVRPALSSHPPDHLLNVKPGCVPKA